MTGQRKSYVNEMVRLFEMLVDPKAEQVVDLIELMIKVSSQSSALFNLVSWLEIKKSSKKGIPKMMPPDIINLLTLMSRINNVAQYL